MIDERTAIREASLADVEYIARNLRLADISEILAYKLLPPDLMAIDTFKRAAWVRCATFNDIPAILYGICPTERADIGVPWMIATNDMMQFKKYFVSNCANEMHAMQNTFPKLLNVVHRENLLSRRWLSWLGFMIHPKLCGVNNQFYLFSRGF